MTGSSPSSRPSIFSYTLTTSLFIILFLFSVFLFTRRTLEPSLSPYLHADIPLPADPRPPTLLHPDAPLDDGDGVSAKAEPEPRGDSRAGGEVVVETETKDREDSAADDVAVKKETKVGGDSSGDGVNVEAEPSVGGDSLAGEEVTVKTGTKEGGYSAADDVALKTETNEGGASGGDGVAVEAEPNDGGDSRADDVAVKTETKEGGNSSSDGVAVEAEPNDGGDQRGEVSAGDKEGSNGESVDMEVVEKMRGCDLYKGTWVKDDEYPLYQPGSCPYVDEAFDCQRNGRRDSDYLRWRWKPEACDLPRFNATDFLVRLRGKRLMLVGDSMNRNQFESMLCVLREGLSNKSSMHEIHGHKITKGRGYYVFKFKDYNCTVEFVRSHFLVKEGVRINAQGSSNPTLSIDRIDKTHARWKRADILVFNTGHWWVHGKTARGKNYYKEGDYIYPKFDATEAYRRALKTWAKWIDENVKPNKQLVFYRGYSSAHFRGGEWDSGGSCNGEVEPVLRGSILDSYPLKMKIVEEVITEMQVPVVLLNVTKLTNFRKDGHPSVYGKTNADGKKVSTRRQDCSHWCLPGVPDAWNHLIYATLLLQANNRGAS